MTLADERYRAITQARELLTEIVQQRITDLDELRRQAKFVLRHFPDETALYIIATDLNPAPPLNPSLGNMLWPPAEKQVCNPRGYPNWKGGYENPNFDAQKIVEVRT